jgi:hypothetical protein
MHRPPYFDWRLDRWKIGLALFVWLGLVLFPPIQTAPVDRQGASPISRPSQRPAVGASTQREVKTVVAQSADLASPVQTAANTEASDGLEINTGSESTQSLPPVAGLTLTILESGQKLLSNSTPLFYGQTDADGLVEILLDGRRYATLADSDGYWQFAPAAPLPVGMTWVRARRAEAGSAVDSDGLSQMALIGLDATPIAVPVILLSLSSANVLRDSTPLLSGAGPAAMDLIIYAQKSPEEGGHPVGEVAVDEVGTWRWQMSAALEPGSTILWVVAMDSAGTAISRSWPVTLVIATDATPSIEVESPTAEVDTTR